MKNRHPYNSSIDIEEVLSETLAEPRRSGGGLDVKKVNTTPVGSSVNNGMRDRMEVSSNKDVDIGLDLLVNKEKHNVREPNERSNRPVSNTRNGYSIDNDRTLTSNVLSELDLEPKSDLNQRDIDNLIDRADKKPSLVNNQDLNGIVESVIEGNSVIEDVESVIHNSAPQRSYGEIRRKKQEIIFKLEKMRRLGVQGIKKFNMSNSVEDMETELERVKYERELESSVKFQRKCLMAFVTGGELLNNKFDFLDFKLDGWSEQVHDGIDEYNEVFEELHEKYSTKVKMAPEIRLLFMLGGSAFMYHLTNSMFKNSVPGMEEIMKQNPDLMKQFASAAINQMQGEEKQAAEMFSNFAPMSSNGPPPPMSGRTSAFNQPSMTPAVNSRTATRVALNESSGYVQGPQSVPTKARRAPPSTARISPPTGVDDILNELRSNTSVATEVEELLSETSSKRVNIQRRKKGGRGATLSIN